MPPIAARYGRQPPTGPLRSHPLNTTRTLQIATTIPIPRATRIETSQPGADHENGKRTVAAVSSGKMACAGAFRAGSCHRIQPYPPGWPPLCTRRDVARGGLTRVVLLSSRRRLLVCISAHRGHAGFVCAVASCVKTASNTATPTAYANSSHSSTRDRSTGYILKPMNSGRCTRQAFTPASPCRHHLTHDQSRQHQRAPEQRARRQCLAKHEPGR